MTIEYDDASVEMCAHNPYSQLNAPGVGPEISAGSGPGIVNIDSV